MTDVGTLGVPVGVRIQEAEAQAAAIAVEAEGLIYIYLQTKCINIQAETIELYIVDVVHFQHTQN